MKYFKDQNDGTYQLFDSATPNPKWEEITQQEWNDLNIQTSLTPEQKRAQMRPLSARQVRLILNIAGYRAAVEAGVSQASQEVQDEWNYANEFERTSPVLNGMAMLLGLSAEDVDAMFEQGVLL